MLILETDRLRLRWFTGTPTDADFLRALLNDPGWLANIGERHVRTRRQALAWIATRHTAPYGRLGFGFWAIERKSDDRLMGMCGLIKRDTLLEVDVVALEMMVLRVLSAQAGGKKGLDIAGLLKIRGSEIQQRYTELLMLAGGPFSLPFIWEAMESGWQGDFVGGAEFAPLAANYFNYRKTTIYGGSNEVQRNIVAQTVLGV